MAQAPNYENPVMPQGLVDAQAGSDQAASNLMGAGTIPPPQRWRTFISPTEANTKFLVSAAGEMTAMVSVGGQILKHPERVNNKFAKFINGVCTTEDPEVIAWLEAHTGNQEATRAYYTARGMQTPNFPHFGFCRDINQEGVEGWAELKIQQVPLAHRPATISPGFNIDRLFAGKSQDFPADPQSMSGELVAKAQRDREVMNARSTLEAVKD